MISERKRLCPHFSQKRERARIPCKGELARDARLFPPAVNPRRRAPFLIEKYLPCLWSRAEKMSQKLCGRERERARLAITLLLQKGLFFTRALFSGGSVFASGRRKKGRKPSRRRGMVFFVHTHIPCLPVGRTKTGEELPNALSSTSV